ncbi:hypothetical protein LX64_00063 [Chitinophaga skermanii]|uniref:Uncharacterized protein n=1 Tax=Chitinophaga skermanii TaxID=331697 RepID=A0A327R1F0_9BACT|nr:hypothetical protein [Chitinophaga skermanii]RAJ10461.1 hypothetical protein LX64_00063 [Chitinophaga skermanii]
MKYFIPLLILLLASCTKPIDPRFPTKSQLVLIKDNYDQTTDSMVYDRAGKLVKRYHYDYVAEDRYSSVLTYLYDKKDRLIETKALLSFNYSPTPYRDSIKYIYNNDGSIDFIRGEGTIGMENVRLFYDKDGVIKKIEALVLSPFNNKPMYEYIHTIVNGNIVAADQISRSAYDDNYSVGNWTYSYDNHINPFTLIQQKSRFAFSRYDFFNSGNQFPCKNNIVRTRLGEGYGSTHELEYDPITGLPIIMRYVSFVGKIQRTEKYYYK